MPVAHVGKYSTILVTKEWKNITKVGKNYTPKQLAQVYGGDFLQYKEF